MAKEAKVIYCDRDKLKHAIHAFVNRYGIIGMSITDFNIMLERNRVDAEPVVRCKDCKWWKTIYFWEGHEHKICVRESHESWRKAEDFCSWGERREDAEHQEER